MFSNASQGVSAYCTLPSSRKSKNEQMTACKHSSKFCNDITAASTYGTVGRRLRQVVKIQDELTPPYKKLKTDTDDRNVNAFGLSNDLSTESIRNACEYVEFSDDESTSRLATFRTPSSIGCRSLRSSAIKTHNKRRTADNPFCTLRGKVTSLPVCLGDQQRNHEINLSSLTLNREEALNVLNELDAILDNHASSSVELTSSPEQTSEKVEDCLLELDTYLDELDDKSVNSSHDCDSIEVRRKTPRRRHKTLPKNIRHSRTRNDGNSLLNRGHILRRTIDNGSAFRCDDGGDTIITKTTDRNTSHSGKLTRSSSPTRKAWSRNSMRKTSLLILPEHTRSEDQAPTSIACETTHSPTNERVGDVEENCNMPPNSPHDTQNVRRCMSQTDVASPSVLTTQDILQEIVQRNAAEVEQQHLEDRPRQFGRRGDGYPRILSLRSEAAGNGNHCLIINHDRPISAPACSSIEYAGQHEGSPTLANVIRTSYIGSEPSSVGSSRNPSPVSLVSSTGSSSIGSTTADQTSHTPPTSPMDGGNTQTRTNVDSEHSQTIQQQGFNVEWPHSFSRILALLSCTLGLFNICRFANQTIQYGGNFLLQFLILSVVFGIPFLWLQMCLGAKIKAGPVVMWKISPICKGIGIALLLAQCVMALYSTIGISWLIVYLRDSFLTTANPLYRWQESYHIFRRPTNVSGNITETVADYFNGIVLQRLPLGRRIDEGVGVRFQVSDRLAFNLAVIWTLVFLTLCKGLKSFGKIVVGLTVPPLIMFIVITCRLLYYIGFSNAQNIFSASDFEDFLINSKTWTAAAQEAFLTWALLGCSIIAICSRNHKKSDGKLVIRREAILVVLLTLLGLCLAGLFGFSCEQILRTSEYAYVPGSYEHIDSYTSVYSLKDPISPALMSFPTKWVPHYSSLVGETYRRPSITSHRESGYQALRLLTELFPAAMAITRGSISWVWTSLTFFTFILFGLGQLCAIWKPISSALGNSISSVLLSCVTGLLLGIPFATEMGISIVHYFDMVFGGAWWLLVLWTAEILAVFLIRGRPYNGDVLVNDLRMTGSMSAFLALSWNVILPIGLIALSIIQYKVSLSSQFYHWRGKSYFSFWTRKIGGLIQVGFLLIVPIAAIIQIYRYLSSGPPDILDRVQLLYRPTQSPLPHHRSRSGVNHNILRRQGGNAYNSRNSDLEANNAQDDAPPKYTPPPSYTTATGARLAKILRQSIRRSVRRFLGDPNRPRAVLSLESADNSLPPDYSTVLSNPAGLNNQTENIEIRPRPLYSTYAQRSLSLGRNLRHKNEDPTEVRPSSACSTILSRARQPYTASDVANVLRTSTRRRESAVTSIAFRIDSTLRNKSSSSAENLVSNAAPLGESNAISLSASPGSSPDNPPHRLETYENTSVI